MTPKRYIRTKPYAKKAWLQDWTDQQKALRHTPADDIQMRAYLIELETALRVAEAEELNRG